MSEAGSYRVGARPLKVVGHLLPPGADIPQELIAQIPRLESWVASRRIVTV